MAESAAHLTLTGPRPADLDPAGLDWTADTEFDAEELEAAMIRSRQQAYAVLAELDAA